MTLSPPTPGTTPGTTSGRRRRLEAPPPEPLAGPPADESRRSAGGNRSASTSGGRRKLPAGHRKRARRRAFPAVPVAASMVTLVAATSGAMSLHTGEKSNVSATPEERTMPAGIALSLTQLGSDRGQAAARADRSDRSRQAGGLDRSDLERNRLAAEARDRQAWELRRERELAGIDRSNVDGDTGLVMERAIHWVLPLSNFRVSAGFGDGGSLWSQDHTGQDFAAPLGTSVRSVGAGEIIYAGYDGPYGYKVEVRHWDGSETWYCHLSSFERTRGTVGAGEVIGYVGSTGNSTGPHLHFEVRPHGGDPVDPIPWLRALGLNI